MIKKILLWIAAIIFVVVLGFVSYILLKHDKTYDYPFPALKISTDSAVISKGKYLVHGPAHCSNCHVASWDDMIRADKGENVPLQGGAGFPMGPLGTLYSRNLTPELETGIGRYSDGQIFRMMRHAVKPDGTSAIPLMMPFWNMADEDLVAVVSYLRSMEPIKNKVPDPDWSFIGKTMRVFAPPFKPIEKPSPPAEAPPMAPTKERGEYLSRYVANCVGCHTESDMMTLEQIGPEYAGGPEFEMLPIENKDYDVGAKLWTRPVNITPHPNSALSRYKTLEQWINRFRMGRLIINSPMHWGSFSRMTDVDLEAIWIYLNSLDPIENDTGPVIFTKED